MKHSSIFIFLSIVLLLYGLINYYILRRTGQALAGLGIARTIILWLLFLLVLSYPLGRTLERFFQNGYTQFLVIAGSFYLGIGFYAFFAALLVDIVRLGNRLVHFFPSVIVNNPTTSSFFAWVACAVFVLCMTFFGYRNATHPRLRQYDLTIQKKAGGLKELTVVAVSDLHLGTVLGRAQLNRVAAMVNDCRPDIVLLAGDVFDEDVFESVEQDISRTLRELRPPFGVFAVTGNHEYYCGVEKAVSYLQKGNVTVLQDSAVRIKGAFYLAGRKDKTAERLASGRKGLTDILASVDKSLPVILMDHQPFHLEEAQQNGVDLQVSGHTHHGQLFPLNLMYGLIYEKDWGYVKKGATHVVVSCGAGTWGPPLRTNSPSEVMLLKLKFIEPSPLNPPSGDLGG